MGIKYKHINSEDRRHVKPDKLDVNKKLRALRYKKLKVG